MDPLFFWVSSLPSSLSASLVQECLRAPQPTWHLLVVDDKHLIWEGIDEHWGIAWVYLLKISSAEHIERHAGKRSHPIWISSRKKNMCCPQELFGKLYRLRCSPPTWNISIHQHPISYIHVLSCFHGTVCCFPTLWLLHWRCGAPAGVYACFETAATNRGLSDTINTSKQAWWKMESEKIS